MSYRLDDELDAVFQRKERRVQRAGWLLIAVILVLALLGLFGDGVLAKTTASGGSGDVRIELEYQRFERMQKTGEMSLRIEAPDQPATEVSIVISGEFLDKVTLQDVEPDPDSTGLEGERAVYTWSVEDWSQALTVRFGYRAHDWRSASGTISVRAGAADLGSVDFTQWLFP